MENIAAEAASRADCRRGVGPLPPQGAGPVQVDGAGGFPLPLGFFLSVRGETKRTRGCNATQQLPDPESRRPHFFYFIFFGFGAEGNTTGGRSRAAHSLTTYRREAW